MLAVFGIALVAFTFWNIARNEVGLFFIFELWLEFNPFWFLGFKRSTFPVVFWLIIIIQFGTGFYFIIAGMFDLDVSWLFG